MNDQINPMSQPKEDIQPSEAEIKRRIAEIEVRRKQRMEIDKLVEGGELGEAMKTAVRAGVSILDNPRLLEQYQVYAENQRELFDHHIKKFNDILKQAKESAAQIETAIEQQEWLAAFFRADAALDNLDILKLQTSINELHRLESKFPSLVTFRQAFQTRLSENIQEAQSSLTWVLEIQQIVNQLGDENQVFTASALRQLVSKLDYETVTDVNTPFSRASIEKPAWLTEIKQQMDEELSQAIKAIPTWFYSRIGQLQADLEWLKGCQGSSEFREAQEETQKWLMFVADRPIGTSRLSVLRREKIATAPIEDQVSDLLNEQSIQDLMKPFREEKTKIDEVNRRVQNWENDIEGIKEKVADIVKKDEENQARRPLGLIIMGIALVALFGIVIWLFIQETSLEEQLNGLSQQIASESVAIKGQLNAVKGQVFTLEDRIADLHPTDVIWQINGRIQTLDSQAPFTGALVIVEAKSDADSEWQVVSVKPGGEFNINYTHLLEPLQVRVQLTNLPPGWEAQLDTTSGNWVASAANTFEAKFNSVAEAAAWQLLVNVGVTRTFTGMVQLGQSFGNVPSGTAVLLFERPRDGEWREIYSQVVGGDGRFAFSYPSAVDEPTYRLQAEFGPNYETTLVSQADWEVDEGGLVTDRPQMSNEVNLVYEVTAVTLFADAFQLDERWNTNTSNEDGSTYHTATITDDFQAVQANIYLPPGAYKMSVWTPIEEGVNAAVRYIVEIENGISEGSEICQAFISTQSERIENNQRWWDISTVTDGHPLRVQSVGSQITVIVQPDENAENGTLIGLGPVRFTTIQVAPEQPITPCQ